MSRTPITRSDPKSDSSSKEVVLDLVEVDSRPRKSGDRVVWIDRSCSGISERMWGCLERRLASELVRWAEKP